MVYTFSDSPLGELLLQADESGLRSIIFQDGKKSTTPEPDWVANPAPFADVLAQLCAYFDGARTSFDLQLAPEGTAFQRTVWRTLESIPYGVTWSYGELARAIGKPTASRAVGAANGANPLPIVIPCHRVIGADGSLTGFGGGLENKRKLLTIEGALHDDFHAGQQELFGIS